MRDWVSLSVFCACVVAVSGSGRIRVAVFVSLECQDVSPGRRSVLNYTVQAAIRDMRGPAGSNDSVEVDVFDACTSQRSLTQLASVLLDRQSSYVAVGGPGLYQLCGVASALQRASPVRIKRSDGLVGSNHLLKFYTLNIIAPLNKTEIKHI